jgi:hypothetical protein
MKETDSNVPRFERNMGNSFEKKMILIDTPEGTTNNTGRITLTYDSLEVGEKGAEKDNELTEPQSLSMLTQQREKILGELFGKFKRDR